MSEREGKRNAEIMERRNAGETFGQIGKALAMSAAAARSAHRREMERMARPAREPVAETRQRLRKQAAVAATKDQPAYPAAAARTFGPSAVMRPYRPALALRLAGARAADSQPAFLSMGSRIPEVRESTQWPA
ncbi:MULTISPECIES: hypothetical protein [unclassified Achromobacter]|uniref:hypothetical protein n=1 Tax=unclassified Achromobacter TaxID=2626865 RepID=UPI000B51856D|nr:MULTISPECIES: hypothetical protein [unclassified Achromobacter]OWT69225.1 hypothetical protein CEY05_28805 [Achromobacter sp. HZ34]OWT70630.1 hypothetical protein CEY04_27635 [Achromobacter sp. HZ28]